MNSKGKRFGGPKSNLGLASVFFLCFLFFLAGFFGPTLLSQDLPSVQSGPRILEYVEERDDSMPHGETGEPRVISVPFQTSLHGSCPVIKGEKWVSTKWIRDEDQDQ